MVVLVIPFGKILESSIAESIFIISFISSFKFITFVVSEPCIYFWIPASNSKAAVVIPNRAKISFAIVTTTSIDGPAIWLNNASKKPPNWIIWNI